MENRLFVSQNEFKNTAETESELLRIGLSPLDFVNKISSN
jgi:hypothetical protein